MAGYLFLRATVRMVGDQVSHVALAFNSGAIAVEVRVSVRLAMREVVDVATSNTEVFLESVTVRTEARAITRCHFQDKQVR